MSIRDGKRLPVQTPLASILQHNVSGILNPCSDVRVEHGKVELQVIDLNRSEFGRVVRGVVLCEGDLVGLGMYNISSVSISEDHSRGSQSY